MSEKEIRTADDPPSTDTVVAAAAVAAAVFVGVVFVAAAGVGAGVGCAEVRARRPDDGASHNPFHRPWLVSTSLGARASEQLSHRESTGQEQSSTVEGTTCSPAPLLTYMSSTFKCQSRRDGSAGNPAEKHSDAF